MKSSPFSIDFMDAGPGKVNQKDLLAMASFDPGPGFSSHQTGQPEGDLRKYDQECREDDHGAHQV
jgi:hypothetical protein